VTYWYRLFKIILIIFIK